MAEERINRKLAAILAADVVGYSRLMGADEEGTLSALKLHRLTVFDPAVAAHNGRIVKLIGDGTIAEFGSVVDAVNCALMVQRAGGAAPNQETQDAHQPRIVLRIGINLGDVIIEGDDIYGDGVNIAARLEPLAEPGGICVSSIVNESVGNRVDAAFRDAGDISVKNIERPIRIWKWHPGAGGAAAARHDAARPVATASIAVLPFTNMSGDPEQEYFSDGITEDIITDLSKIAGLTVIARNSTFTYKGQAVDVRAVGRDLGVRSVLEGSIRRAGNRVRITAQLIDATSGGHLWAERYDRDVTDIFAVQDDVTRRIVEALKVTLTPADKAKLAGEETTNIEAYETAMRGREILMGNPKNRKSFHKATALFLRAIAADPNFAKAYAGLSFAYMFDYQNRWSEDPDSSLPLAKRYAETAIEKNPNEPLARVVAAVAATFDRDLDGAKEQVDIALSLSPNFSLAYNVLGGIYIYSGRPLEAIAMIERAMRLDPNNSSQYLHFLGTAYLLAGKYETAATLLKQRIAFVPGTDFSRALLTSALGHLGEIDEARRVWKELQDINPNYAFRDHFGRLPYKNQDDVERIAAGLVKAGIDVTQTETAATADAGSP